MKIHANETIKLNKFPLSKYRLLVVEKNHNIYAMLSLQADVDANWLNAGRGRGSVRFFCLPRAVWSSRGEYSHALFLPFLKRHPVFRSNSRCFSSANRKHVSASCLADPCKSWSRTVEGGFSCKSLSHPTSLASHPRLWGVVKSYNLLPLFRRLFIFSE